LLIAHSFQDGSEGSPCAQVGQIDVDAWERIIDSKFICIHIAYGAAIGMIRRIGGQRDTYNDDKTHDTQNDFFHFPFLLLVFIAFNGFY
jgi:hypothetical protein